MAISTDRIKKKKKDYDPEPARKMPSMKPFGKKGKSIQRNPHRDSGDKKPSLKTKASIIKDKAKKGQGLARGGMLKSIIKIPPLPAPQPMPRSGTISTIDKGMRKPRPAEKFVKIRERINKLGGYAMGGEASESVARSKIVKDQRKRQQDKLNRMLERLYGKQKIVPKKKPKRDKTKIGDTIKPKLGIK